MVMSSTFMGGSFAKGACPCASSNIVIPKDQISAKGPYLCDDRVCGDVCDWLRVIGCVRLVVVCMHIATQPC